VSSTDGTRPAAPAAAWLPGTTSPDSHLPWLGADNDGLLPLQRCVRRIVDPLFVTLVATLLLLVVDTRPGVASPPFAGLPWAPLLILWSAFAAIVIVATRRDRSVAAIVAVTDHRGVITYVNDRFCAISKYPRNELLGQDHRIVNSGYHSKDFIRTLWRTIARGQVWRGELRNRARDGTFYWVDTTIVPFLDGRGKPRQYLSIRSDITQRKFAETQLREQAALTHLGQVVAMVAHEIRNPLAGLRGSLQMLERRIPADGADRGVIQTMIQRIDGLNAKVSDLLKYARPVTPALCAIDARALAVDAAASARAAMGNGHPEIPVIGPSLSARADPDMLRAVLLNLTVNACQAAGGQPVDIEISAHGDACRIAVRDRGPGLPASVRARLFEPFVTTRPEGTGLGLAIVKRLVEPQGGRVTLEDREGGGTLAVVQIPAASGSSR
jgi:two-component system CheB/CheR fusion protein